MQAMQVSINTDVRKMVPLEHRYIKNFLEHREDVSLGNDVRLIVADSRNDDIFNDEYMQALKAVTDDVFALKMSSLRLSATIKRTSLPKLDRKSTRLNSSHVRISY